MLFVQLVLIEITSAEDFRGKVDFFMGPASSYNDWPADDIRAFGRSQLDIVENVLKIAKTLLLASDVNSAVVYTRSIKSIQLLSRSSSSESMAHSSTQRTPRIVLVGFIFTEASDSRTHFHP